MQTTWLQWLYLAVVAVLLLAESSAHVLVSINFSPLPLTCTAAACPLPCLSATCCTSQRLVNLQHGTLCSFRDMADLLLTGEAWGARWPPPKCNQNGCCEEDSPHQGPARGRKAAGI